MIRIGIDLGSNSIRLISEETILFDEPCMIALDKKNHVLAIGNEAAELKIHKDQSIQIISPLTSTQINFEALDLLLEQICFEFKVFKTFQKTILLLSYPTTLPKEYCDILKQHLLDLGAYRVYFEKEIWFSAIGAGLNLTLPITHCMMNIGSSNCDIASFANGTIQNASQLPLSGNHILLAIKKWLKSEKEINISFSVLDTIQRKVGNVVFQSHPESIEIQGTDSITNEVKTTTISENDLIPLLEPYTEQWAQWIIDFIHSLNKEQQEDIEKQGIVACGGTIKLHGLANELTKRTGYLIFMSEDPVHTVARGIQILLSNMNI